MVAYRAGEFSVFLYGFAKSERDNIDDAELMDLRAAARFYFSLSDDALELAVIEGKLTEIDDA